MQLQLQIPNTFLSMYTSKLPLTVKFFTRYFLNALLILNNICTTKSVTRALQFAKLRDTFFENFVSLSFPERWPHAERKKKIKKCQFYSVDVLIRHTVTPGAARNTLSSITLGRCTPPSFRRALAPYYLYIRG